MSTCFHQACHRPKISYAEFKSSQGFPCNYCSLPINTKREILDIEDLRIDKLAVGDKIVRRHGKRDYQAIIEAVKPGKRGMLTVKWISTNGKTPKS